MDALHNNQNCIAGMSAIKRSLNGEEEIDKMKNKYVLIVILFGLVTQINQLGCSKPLFDCGEVARTEVESPGGKYIATLFERNCGATTGFVTHVNLRLRSDVFHSDGNGTIKDGEIFVVRGQPAVTLTWSDQARLTVECTRCLSESIFKQEKQWKDVAITYTNVSEK